LAPRLALPVAERIPPAERSLVAIPAMRDYIKGGRGGSAAIWGMHMALTADLGSFLEAIRFDSLPAEAVDLARDAFTDTIGVIMAGIPEAIVRIVHGEISEGPAPRQARACLSRSWPKARTSAPPGAT
jgi:hypothetical protein